MFGLPFVTSLFVFGGFLIPLALAVWFGLKFRSDTDEWWTADDLFAGKREAGTGSSAGERA